MIFPFNDTAATLAILEEQAGQLAAVIIDPIPARLGFVEVDRAYLQALRDYCTRTGTVLVFDEVFCNRIGYHGAQTEKPGLLGSEGIKWNFTKFLVDRQGKVVARYAPTDKPESIAADVEQLL